MNLYRKEFPDYPVDDMPEIPDGFVDESWHNDVCPSFHNEALNLVLWVDYKDASQREFPETPRYQLTTRPDTDNQRSLVCTDDWSEITKEITRHTVHAEFERNGFQVWHTGGGCEAWQKDLSPNYYMLITDDDAGLGERPDESYGLSVYKHEPDDECIAAANGDQPQILAQARECEADMSAFVAANPWT